MIKAIISVIILISFFNNVQAQTASDTLTTRLSEVVITADRLSLPVSQNSRAIEIINSETIKSSGANSVVMLLQMLAGIDVRQRGVSGMQADLYIRGGSFDQTLLLIDGIKLDDAQTGHHTLNFALPLEVIERIEIIKGAAARVFGQNAFTGAVNIVTKKGKEKQTAVGLQMGSYEQLRAQATASFGNKNSQFIFHYSNHSSSGYRYNTDFKTQNYFFKAHTTTFKKAPLTITGSFSNRQFGANGFYATPDATEQFETTQAGMFALASEVNTSKWQFKPRLYWRRGQDEYTFIRSNPSVYRNLHLTHKVGLGIDTKLKSNLGLSGFGVDLARVSISSNNLGYRQRYVMTTFMEHRFYFKNKRIDLTPGVALSHFSDFGEFAFPGVDLGVQINAQWRAYGNLGYTYRIPTYTDLYYSDRTTLGNAALSPEQAFTQEVGVRHIKSKVRLGFALFNRNAANLIDYVKEDPTSLWQATNIQKVDTQGFETSILYDFTLGGMVQQLHLTYTYLNDTLRKSHINFSRYSINSLRHHGILTWRGNLSTNLKLSAVYKLGQRPVFDAYHVVDFSFIWNLGAFKLDFMANNIFNAVYTETNLVPMPKANGMLGIQFAFD